MQHKLVYSVQCTLLSISVWSISFWQECIKVDCGIFHLIELVCLYAFQSNVAKMHTCFMTIISSWWIIVFIIRKYTIDTLSLFKFFPKFYLKMLLHRLDFLLFSTVYNVKKLKPRFWSHNLSLSWFTSCFYCLLPMCSWAR